MSTIHLTESQLEALCFHRGGAEELRHLFLCPACRGRLTLLEEALAELRPARTGGQPLALAAKGAQISSLRSLTTEDESLVCRLERDADPDTLRLTVLADPRAWGEIVVIWPGAGDPLPAPVGRSVSIPADHLAGIRYWIVSRAEVTWTGEPAALPARIEGEYNTLKFDRMAAIHVSYTEPALALTLLKEAGTWRALPVPTLLVCECEFTLALFTPLSAQSLR